jgi:N-acetylmuramoyl-L-alanine amidase
MSKTLLKILIFTTLLVPMSFAYASEPIRILLVPGHDNEVWGSQYGNIKESDMNLRLATELFNILKKDKRFEVHITRDSSGYTKTFADYFANNQQEIISFKENAKNMMMSSVENGSFIKKESVPHVTVNEYMSIILYGINRWANDNKMDAVIHIHFNDYPREEKWTIGKYKGFAIYMPDEQLANSKESTVLAKNIFKQMKTKYITSTYEKELDGLIPDQTLIALGSNNTLAQAVRSVLIEYGYIYRFKNKATRHEAYTIMANLTAQGIKKYFFKK